jgi:putative ABC transport system permease protein
MSSPSDDEIREELNHHLESRTEWNQHAGLSPDQARSQAQRSFGNLAQIHEQTRAVNISLFFDDLRRDLLYASRSFARSPIIPLTAILILTLGIGSATAVFSLIDRLLFRPLPYPQDSQLVSLGMRSQQDKSEYLLNRDYATWQHLQTPFALIASTIGNRDCDLTEGLASRLRCVAVESTMLPLLGITPIRGTSFTKEQDLPKGPRVALLSYPLWVSRFGSSESIVGRTISLDGQPTLIIGILPPHAELPNLQKFDLIVPQQLNMPMRYVQAFARLKPGLTPEQARQAMLPLFMDTMKAFPTAMQRELSLSIRPLREHQIHDFKQAAWLLFGAVIIVFLIACANLANLLIARNAARHREISIRYSIGASTTRLIRQLLTESTLLAATGCLFGTLAAWAFLRLALAFAPAGIPRLNQATLDLRILAFALTLTLLAGLIAGLLPALHLKRNAQSNPKNTRLRFALVTAQIAASLVLLSSASLLLKSLWNIQSTQLGFQTENVISVKVALGRNGFEQPEKRSAFFKQLEETVSSLPTFNSIALADSIPPAGFIGAYTLSAFEVEGQTPLSTSELTPVPWRTVTENFFSILNIPILKGRPFDSRDREPGQDNIILGEVLARRLLPSTNPIGQRLRIGKDSPWQTIVGVAAPFHNSGFAPRMPEFYVPMKRNSTEDQAYLLIRTTASLKDTDTWLKTQIAALAPAVPVTAEPLSQRVYELSARPRFQAILLTLFAVIGLILAVLGLYGVISFLVTQRTREMGIRLALGSTASSVVLLLIRQALQWTLVGLALGLAATWFSSTFIKSLLHEVPSRDPASYAISFAALGLASLGAAWLPASRAARIDPATALRTET